MQYVTITGLVLDAVGFAVIGRHLLVNPLTLPFAGSAKDIWPNRIGFTLVIIGFLCQAIGQFPGMSK